MNETVLNVKGMTCGGCVQSVQNGLGRLAGVKRVEADLKTGRVRVEHEPGKPDVATFEAAVDDLGYEFGGVG